MKNVKFSSIGLMDILYFTTRPKNREKIIQSASTKPLVAEYETNRKAEERHPEKQEFVICDIVEHDANVKSYFLKKKDGTNPAFFRAGQYVVVRQKIDGKLIARPISISCGPDFSLDGKYVITVKRAPGGFMSEYILDNWKVGDEVTTSGPQGVFYYEGLRDAKNVVAVAGGSGITPILSMAYAIMAGDEDFNLTVLYGSRTEKDVLFKKEFEEISKRTDKVKVVYVLSDEEKEGCESGFITAELIKKYAGSEQYSIFASGPQSMYTFLDGEVEKLGIEQKFYRKELFGSAKEPWKLPGYPQEAKDKVFNLHVKMCNKEYDISCNANENMLVALERAGIAGPNRCRGGICGWCRSKLLSGEVFIPARTADATQTRCTATFTHARRLRSPTQALKCLTTNKRFKTAKKEPQCGSFFFCLVSCFLHNKRFIVRSCTD